MEITRGDEIELIDRAKKSPAAFGRLYDMYYKKILNYVIRSTYNVDVSQDIVAETFYKALKAFPKFELKNGGTFQAWIYRIASNEINMYYRKNNRYSFKSNEDIDLYYSKEVPEEEISAVQSDLDLDSEVKDLMVNVNKLDEKYRSIIHLRYFEGLKFSEIEEVTGIKEETLKSHMSRALSKLKEMYKPIRKVAMLTTFLILCASFLAIGHYIIKLWI